MSFKILRQISNLFFLRFNFMMSILETAILLCISSKDALVWCIISLDLIRSSSTPLTKSMPSINSLECLFAFLVRIASTLRCAFSNSSIRMVTSSCLNGNNLLISSLRILFLRGKWSSILSSK